MKRIRSLLLAATLALAPHFAIAQQTVNQAGPITPGHVPVYVGPPGSQAIIQDSGPAGGAQGPGGGISELNVTATGPAASGPPFAGLGTGPYGTINCNYDGPVTSAAGYHYLCFSPNAQGGGLMAYGAAGGASTDPMQFIINGVTFQFPLNFSLNGYLIANGLNNPLTALAPVDSSVAGWNGSGVPTAFANSTTVNGVNCQLGGTCAITAPASSITPGSTTIVGGTNGDIEYNNAGTLGEKGTTGTGNVVQATSPTVSGLTVTGSLTATSLITASDLAVGAATIANGGLYGATLNAIPYGGGAGTLPGFAGPSTNSALYWNGSGIPTSGALPVSSGGLNGATQNAVPYGGGVATNPSFTTPTNSAIFQTTNSGVPQEIAPDGTLCFNSGTSGVAANSVRCNGAIGNSNGTTGNGHDDTTAIQSSLGSSSGLAYLPFLAGGSIYRTTSSLTGSSGGIYRVKGDGPASEIYNDSASATSTFAFTPSTACPTAEIPCVVVDGVKTTPPTQAGSGNYSYNVSNEQGFTLRNSVVNGGRVGAALATSYGPIFEDFTIEGVGSNAIFSNDATFNVGTIERGKLYGNGLVTNDAALALDGGSNGALRLGSLDIEGNYAGLVMNGTNEGFVLESLYLEQQTSFDFFFNGTNKGCRIEGNRIGSGKTTTWSNLQQCDIAHNVFGGGGGTITISAANDVHDNIVESGVTLATNASAPTSCGTSPSVAAMSTDYAGQITTGSSATTSCSYAFAGTYTNAPFCVATPIGSANSGLFLNVTNAGITFNYSSATSQKISYRCTFSN